MKTRTKRSEKGAERKRNPNRKKELPFLELSALPATELEEEEARAEEGGREGSCCLAGCLATNGSVRRAFTSSSSLSSNARRVWCIKKRDLSSARSRTSHRE